MKILIGLSIVQTLLLAIIGMRVLSMDARMDTVTDTSLDVLSATSQLKNAGPVEIAQTSAASLTSEDVRWIIQEELASFAEQHPVAAGQRMAQNKTTRQKALENGEPLYALKADVQQELDYFIGRGDITQSEMTKLQIKIAKLPPSERGEMLSRLTKSLSAGEIDGQF